MATTYPPTMPPSISEADPRYHRTVRRLFAAISAIVSLPDSATLADRERLLEIEGRELMRQLLQDDLDRLFDQESTQPPCDLDDPSVTCRPTTRQLRSVFGDVEIRRRTWKAPESPGRRPLDAQLNAPDGLYSHRVAAVLGAEVVKASFDSAEAALRSRGISVPRRQAEELSAKLASHFDEFYAQRTATLPPQPHAVLAMSADGKGIPMRTADLRPETKKRAQTKGPRTRPRLGPGEKADKKRMAEVAAIWWQEPTPRTPEDIVGHVDGTNRPDPPKLSAPVGKRVWASVERDLGVVIAELFDEAERRDPKHAHRWVVLVDGNRDQITAIKREAKRRGVTVELVLDVIHVVEYLWRAASALFGNEPAGRAQADGWVSHQLHDLLRGASGSVASRMSNMATKGKVSPTAIKALRKSAKYLTNHRSMLRYDLALKAGFPIATGVIEGACRHLVKDRMEITGARWRLVTAEAVLRLRAVRSSGDWDGYLAFYEMREHANNHAWYFEAAVAEAA